FVGDAQRVDRRSDRELLERTEASAKLADLLDRLVHDRLGGREVAAAEVSASTAGQRTEVSVGAVAKAAGRDRGDADRRLVGLGHLLAEGEGRPAAGDIEAAGAGLVESRIEVELDVEIAVAEADRLALGLGLGAVDSHGGVSAVVLGRAGRERAGD